MTDENEVYMPKKTKCDDCPPRKQCEDCAEWDRCVDRIASGLADKLAKALLNKPGR